MKPVLLASALVLLSAGARADSFYESNPTYEDPIDDDASWTFLSPAAAGLNETLLGHAADELEKLPYSWSLVVVRHDALVFERYFHGSHKRASNNVHSASKSILSAAVGIAANKGLLSPEQPVSDFLPGAPKGLLLRHLLTMSAGIQWTEDETEYVIQDTPNWVDAILHLPYPDAPGSKFLYSSGLTHLLSAALTRASGMSTADFAQKFLFDRIGITPEHWGHDPQGISSGGYNLYLTPRELAKFGRLYLRGGEWNGEQVVPRAWVEASLAKQINAREGFDYGYNWWERSFNGHAVKFAWGFGGQFCYLVPDLDMVVVMTTNTAAFEPDFDGETIMKMFVLPAADQH